MSTVQILGNLGEFIGAVGVVISLVYLAGQMSQNTTSVRAASFNSMVQNSIRLLEHTFRDSEFAAFLYRAEQDPEALTPEERLRWDSYMTAAYRHFGNLVYQYRVGALDRQMWEAYQRTLRDHLKVEAWRVWFDRNRLLFSEALVEEVAKQVALLEEEERLASASRHAAEAPRGNPGNGPSASQPVAVTARRGA